MLEGGQAAIFADEDVVGASRARELEKRRDLERLLGRKTMETEILREALDLARPKQTDIAAAVVERSPGRFKVKAVAEALQVSRSNLIDRPKQRTKARGPYREAEDAAIMPLIRTVVDERLTYGYRRFTALVNRRLRQDGKPTVNAKRVLRIMQQHALTLERHSGLPSSRTHDGRIIVLASNLRNGMSESWTPPRSLTDQSAGVLRG